MNTPKLGVFSSAYSGVSGTFQCSNTAYSMEPYLISLGFPNLLTIGCIIYRQPILRTGAPLRVHVRALDIVGTHCTAVTSGTRTLLPKLYASAFPFELKFACARNF